MKNKINIRLAGIAILAIVATMFGITFIYYGLFEKQVRTDLAVSAKLLRDTHYFEVVNVNIDRIDLSTDITELRVTWVGADGTVLYDNDAGAEGLSNHIDRPEIQQAFSEGVGETVRKSDTMNKNTFYYAVLLDNGTVLRVAMDAESLWSVFISAAPIIALILMGILLICIGISHLLTKQLIRPIETMAGNLEDADYASPYKELEPFTQMIRAQHADILSAAKARQDFTANVSHELKTPLTAISGYAELLKEGMVKPEDQREFAARIYQEAARLTTLVQDIIRLSKLEDEQFQPEKETIDLYEMSKEIIETLQPIANHRHISLSFTGQRLTIVGVRQIVYEMLYNLCENAVNYNKDDGNVILSCEQVENGVCWKVTDTGIGIPQAEQERVFERFYRVDKSHSRATGGTGLGLSIVKHGAQLHGAVITLESRPGAGTMVSLLFSSK